MPETGYRAGELLAASELMSWGVSAIPGGRPTT
jgi:hypothetical protein